jgi:hypothetical protein
MSFNESIEKYKSIYYHFLDGLIGAGGGSTIYSVLTTLKDLTPGILPQEITFALPNYLNRTDKEVLINLEFTNNVSVPIDFIYDLSANIPLEYLKFCIIPLGFNEHQTTTIIFIKDDKMFLYILNTGLDMQENGVPSTINNETLYQLTKGYEICDNIQDPTKLNKSYEIIKYLLFIGYFYKFIENNEYKNKKKYSKHKQ